MYSMVNNVALRALFDVNTDAQYPNRCSRTSLCQRQECGTWAREGECSNNPRFMLESKWDTCESQISDIPEISMPSIVQLLPNGTRGRDQGEKENNNLT
eukprot:1360838-Amorphochlora_amoeboformis.AAC.1